MSTPADKLPSPEAEEVLQRALRLPRDEQEYLAARLRFAVPTDPEGWPVELHPDWKDEIVRRARRLEAGSANVVDGEEAFRRLLAKYGG